MFRLACKLVCLLRYIYATGTIPYVDWIGVSIFDACWSLIRWWDWWSGLCILKFVYIIGVLVSPFYYRFFIYIDTFPYVQGSRKLRKGSASDRRKANGILVLAGYLGVMNDVINLDSLNLQYLRTPIQQFNDTMYASKIIEHWKIMRSRFGDFPPSGWPLNLTLFMMMLLSTSAILLVSYFRIFKATVFGKHLKHNIKAVSAAYQSAVDKLGAHMSLIFDSDTTTMVIDNSANCIIWRDKEDFEPDSYREFSPEEAQGIATACGEGFPKGMGTLRVDWYDDNDRYHHFALAGALHIPSSPVNILGICAFSRIIEDYEERGTRIDSSGQESIFSWNHGKFRRSFPHSDAGLPELPVNDGYSKFHRFCHFVETIQPIKQQCYAVNDGGSGSAPYKIGEILTFRENDHVEDGVLERIDFDETLCAPVFTIKFRDSRRVTATKEMILAKDEDDVASLPIQPSEFLRHANCLSEEDLKLIRHPLPLSTLEREWMREHDRLGHISFSDMDKLVKGGMLDKKFAALRGRTMLCPSCMFGKMKRRPWRVKGVANRKFIRK